MRTATISGRDTVAAYINLVYMWMTVGLGITGITAYLTSLHPEMVKTFSSMGPFLLIFAIEVVLIICIHSVSESVSQADGVGAALIAGSLFAVFTALNGVILSGVFLIYTLPSIYLTFALTSGLFGFMTVYGFVTKTDLSSLGNILFMCLLGLIAAMIVNMFLGSSTVQYVLSCIGILVFTLYTAYDAQEIKKEAHGNPTAAMAICASLGIYLDFINLFLNLLEIVGQKNDD